MAIAKRPTDLWGYVQRALLEEVGPAQAPEYYSRTVRLIAPPTISLREHFRCVPEIIRFSNDHFYRDAPLIPLRQAPPNRLRPLMSKYIAEGTCKGEGSRIQNQAEASDNGCAVGTGVDRMQAAGFNTVQADATPAALAALAARGLKAMVWIGQWNKRSCTWEIPDSRLPSVIGPIEHSPAILAYYLADEPRTTCFPTQSLVGIIGNDGRSGDWFVLDRWAS